MKIAILSAELMSGKSSIIALISGVFSRTQRKSVSIINTGNVEPNKEIISITHENKDLANSYVIKAVLQNGTDDERDILNYATKQGLEDVYIFDATPSNIADADKMEFFETCVDNIPTDLTMIEITGDINSEINQFALEKCDACIILFKPNKRSMEMAKELRASLPDKHKNFSSCYLCNEFDQDVLSEKEIDKEIGDKSVSILKVPFNKNFRKMGHRGMLDKLIVPIVKGEQSVLDSRIRFQEIMQWMFDTPNRKVIRGVDKWYS